MAKLRQLRGRLAVITGGARGIGRCTAEALLAQGLKVIIADIDELSAVRTADELASKGWIEARSLDVTEPQAFSEMIDAIERTVGPVDVLVNNAGIMAVDRFMSHTSEVDSRQIDINLQGVIAGMRAVLPHMLERDRGHIINIASVAGKYSPPGIAVYAATKHAVVGLTEGVRREYISTQLAFSYVMPSLVNTELASGARPLVWPPMVQPEDVANAVVRALKTAKVDLFVPRIARVAAVLPAILPRRLSERIGRILGSDSMFSDVDDHARRAYRDRARTSSEEADAEQQSG